MPIFAHMLGSKHELEVRGVAQCKINISAADCGEARVWIVDAVERRQRAITQTLKAFSDDRRHDRFAIRKMMVRRLVADARPPRHFAHAEPFQPLGRNQIQTRIEQRATQIFGRRFHKSFSSHGLTVSGRY